MSDLIASNLEQFKSFIRENLTSGKNMSIRGVARMTGTSDKAIGDSANLSTSRLAEKLTAHGFEGANLTKTGFPPLAVVLTIEYYAYESPQKKSELAQQFMRLYGTYGLQKVIEECTQVEEVKPISLPPAEIRVNMLVTSLEKLGIDLHNPRYQQALQDHALNILGVSQPKLPESQTRWVGVVELAEELGFSEAIKLVNRSVLGRYVSKEVGEEVNRKKESRLVNGTQRECWVYEDCEVLRKTITSFFN